MRRRLLIVMVGFLLGRPAALWAEEGPRALIERAVRAQGLPSADDRPKASWVKFKGRLCGVDGARFTAEAFQQAPRRFKMVLDLELPGSRVSEIEVRNGAKAWVHVNDQTQELDARRLASLDRSDYIDRVTGLVALLKDSQFTLTALPPSQVAGRATVGVKVSSRGRPDIRLYFERDSGLLVKSAYRDREADDDHETNEETLYSDYREVDYAAADETTLRAAHRAVDGPALLELFRGQTLVAGDAGALKALVRQLGDRSFRKREQAAGRLVAAGGAALPLLRQAARSADPEVARRAAECVRHIEAASGELVLAAAARLLALRRPPGTAEVLLAYLPHAASDPVVREVQAAVAAVARPGGREDPLMVQALEDKDPKRRAAAAAALGRDGGAYERQAGRRVYLTGLKEARKVLCRRDGEDFLEWEVIDFQLFNRLDDEIFAKP
jgi:hypothetical protein